MTKDELLALIDKAHATLERMAIALIEGKADPERIQPYEAEIKHLATLTDFMGE